jgi:hypothetical protein
MNRSSPSNLHEPFLKNGFQDIDASSAFQGSLDQQPLNDPLLFLPLLQPKTDNKREITVFKMTTQN